MYGRVASGWTCPGTLFLNLVNIGSRPISADTPFSATHLERVLEVKAKATYRCSIADRQMSRNRSSLCTHLSERYVPDGDAVDFDQNIPSFCPAQTLSLTGRPVVQVLKPSNTTPNFFPMCSPQRLCGRYNGVVSERWASMVCQLRLGRWSSSWNGAIRLTGRPGRWTCDDIMIS